MQHHVGSRLRQYLLLVRLPNVFTAPSNVAAGYFAAGAPGGASYIDLAALMVSSGLLYVAGIVLNDYFDIETDRKERPSRPLPSGSISKRNALVLAAAALVAANAIALAVGAASLVICLVLAAIIIAYDRRLKHTAFGPFAMGGARFLNVILGSSTALSIALTAGATVQLDLVIFAAASLSAHVVTITMLSRKEVGSEKPSKAVFSLVFINIVAIAAIGILQSLHWAFLLNLSLFAAVMAVTFRRHIATDSPSAQKAIRNMVISIIILDSVFVSGTAGLAYGLATLLFVVPAAILAKKLYVT